MKGFFRQGAFKGKRSGLGEMNGSCGIKWEGAEGAKATSSKAVRVRRDGMNGSCGRDGGTW